MEQIVLVFHLLVAIGLVIAVLIQRSEGGGLGIGGGGGGMGSLVSVRGTANFLTKITTVLAVCFVCTSLTLAILASRGGGDAPVSGLGAEGGGESALPDLPPISESSDPLTQD